MTNFNFFSRLASWMDGLSSRIRPVSLSYSGSSTIACSTEKQPRDNREMSEQQSGARVAREWLKYAAMVAMLFIIGSGNAWGVVNNGDLFERISAAPAANDEVIFVNQAETYACGTTQNTNNRAVVSISTSSHQYIYASSDNVQVFTVKKNSANFGFHTGTGYIYSASSSNNYLKTNSTAASTSPSGTAAWSSTVSSSVFTFKNASNTSYYLQFNGTSYFSQYKNTQKNPYLYKKVMSAPTAVAASSITSSGATITITDATNVNNYELYYSTSSTAPTAGTTATTTITGGKSKTLTGLSASTNYYLWARAFSTSPARKTGWVALSGSYFTTSASSKTLSSIAITNAPTTTKYLVGETFSKTGAVVTATYSDATTANVSASATWTPTTGLVAGSNTITASYTEGGVTKTATTTVTAYSVTVQKQDEDGTTIADAGVTASATGRTLTASGGSTNYVFKQWKFGTASGTSIASSSSASTSLTGTPTAAVTVIAEFYKPITITYKANGSTFTTQTYGYGGTLAFPASKPDGATYSCTGKTFVGWVGEANKDYSDASTPPTYATAGGSVTAAATYYAVFADATPGGVSWIQTTSVSVGDSVIIAEIDHVADGKTGKELTGFSSTSTVYGLSADYASTPAGTKKWKVVTGYNSTGVAFQSGSDYLYWTSGNSLNVNSELSAYTSWTVTTESSRAKIANNNTSTRIICWNSGSPRFACYSSKSHGEEISSGSGTYYYYPVFYKKTGGVTYSNYATTCCTPLGTINGSVSWTNPTTAVLTWDNIDNVDSWTAKWKTGAGSYATTNVSAITTNGAGKKTCTVTGLSCNTSYDFLIIATPDDGYCVKEEELTNKNSGKWDLDYTFSGVALKDGDLDEGTGVLCGDLEVTFEPLSVAYELPSDVTVTIGGNSKTKGTDYTWDSSTGELHIDGEDIDGAVAVSCTASLVSCLADPSIGAVSLKTGGTFNLGQVDVTVATSETGSATCAWTDYGFVWSESANPTVGGSGCTKVAVGSDGSATTWNGSLTKTSFATGTTYYYRAYGKNSKDGAAFVYSSSDGTFTPRSVAFTSNGGSSVSTIYVNSGGTVSAPLAPTKTGYTFSKWQLNGEDYDFESAVSANITLDAVWSANTYTVTLAKNYGSAGSSNVIATFGQNMPDMGTKPSRAGYEFTGYYANNDGTGTKYYNADKSSAHVWDQAEDKTIYAAWSPKNYTITLNNEGADEGHEGTESIAVTYDSNDNLTSAITKPEKTGYKFSGYFTEKEGAGTQLIGEDGNVIASVSNYTSATKQWIKASGDVTLYAYWRPSYTVTWYVNGKTTTEPVVSGEKVAALPTNPTTNDCDKAKVFVGWLASEIDGVSASEPSGLFATQSSSPVITGNTTFYAVFADEGVGARTTIYYEPFKSASSNTDWSDAGDYFDNTNTASITTTTSWKVSKSTTSPSDYDGASGDSHMFCGSSEQSIVFDFGDKSDYVDLQLSFGFKNEAAKDKARTIGCYLSGNGGESWTDNLISVSTIKDQDWHIFSYDISNESIRALQIKFSTLAANASRVDDIKLTGCAKTYSNYVTYCTNEFNDNEGNGLWSDPANWTSGVVPSIHHSIHLTKPMTIDVPNAQAKEIIIDKSESKTGQLVIAANMSLEVAGTITRENGSAPTASDLVLESGASGNATLIFDNSNSAAATVQMYSKATSEGGWKWQYIAAPAAVSALDNYYGGYLYKWVESSWAAVGRDATMELFAGYCVSYPTAGHTFAIEGTLAPTTSKSITVPAGKSMVVGNSWTAPIQITQLEDEDFSGLLKNVYLYNTGNDKNHSATTTSSPTGDAIYAAGTYISVPIHSASYFDVKVISSLQGFFVKDDDTQEGDGTLSLSYSKHVRPSGGNSVVNGAMHAPKRVADETDRPAVLKMKVSGSQYDDRLILLEREDFTTGYDAGWDGDKMGDVATSPRITTTREDGTADAVAALPDLEGTLINFRAASTDDQYTLYFDYETEDAEPLYLLDLTNNAYTRVETGGSYTFFTTDKADHKRFALTRYRAPQITTGVEDALEDNEQSKAVKFIENDKLYILRNGVLYDGTGKKVIEN